MSYHNICKGNTINQENECSQRAFLSCFYDHSFSHTEYNGRHQLHLLRCTRIKRPLEQFGVKTDFSMVHSSMHFRNMHIEKISSTVSLTAMFAIVNKRPRKVYVFHMFSQVSFIIALFPTNGTLVGL